MNIVVLVKPVPKNGVGKFNDDFTISRNEISAVVNPYDLHALEEALRIREKQGGKVSVVTLGSEKSKECLRYCFSLGVDEAVLIKDDSFRGSDTYATAVIFKTFLEKYKEYDLILCGKSSTDGSTAQVPAELAALLNMEFSTNVKKCDCGKDYVQCEAEYDNYIISRKQSYPVLLSLSKEINVPRMPTVKGILASRKQKPIVVGNDMLEIDANHCGMKGSLTKVRKTTRLNHQSTRAGIMYSGENAFHDHFKKNLKSGKDAETNEGYEILKPLLPVSENVIAVICESEEKRLCKESMEAVSIACELSYKWNAKLITVTYGNQQSNYSELMEQLSKTGVITNYMIPVEDRNLIETAKIADEVIPVLQKEKTKMVLMAGTIRGRELAPFIAAKTCSGLTADCTDLDIQDGKLIQTRPAFGGEVYAVIESKNSIYEMATVKPNIYSKKFKVDGLHTENIVCKKLTAKKDWAYEMCKNQVSLNQKVIFGIGKGVCKKEYVTVIKEYCKKKKFGLCGTREVIDQGLLTYAHQVGLTGKIIDPEIYVAIGISGALEHVVGIMNSSIIVSINQNEAAPITKTSDYFYKNNIEEFIQYLKEEMLT